MATLKLDDKLIEILDQLAADLDTDRSTLMHGKIADLGLDSMDTVTLVFDIEEALETDIDINALDTDMSIADLIAKNTTTESVT